MGTTAASAVWRGASGAAPSRRWPLAQSVPREISAFPDGIQSPKKTMLRIG